MPLDRSTSISRFPAETKVPRRAGFCASPARRGRTISGRAGLLSSAAAVVGLLLSLGVAQPADARQLPTSDAVQIKKDLHADLGEVQRRAEAVRAGLAGAGTGASIDALIEAFDRVRADDLLIAGVHRQVEEQLTAAGSAVGLHRQLTAANGLRARLDLILRLFDDVQTAATGPVDVQRLRGSLDALLSSVRDATESPVDRTPLGQGVTYRANLNLPVEAPATAPTVVPAYLDRAPRAPVPADLAAGTDVTLRGDIEARAKALRHSPIDIFQFVLNGTRMEFYDGAMKGAAATLREGAGNDVDQASLLIALMRASGIPARYVRGVVELPLEQAAAWTGVPDARRVADVLARAGIRFRAIRQAGAVTAFHVDHTWVEVSVAYANYRGAPLDPRGRSWIPLDPSMKFQRFTPGLEVLAAIGFTADQLVPAYMAGPQLLSPLDFYRKAILDYLTASNPGARFEDGLARWTHEPINPGLLPSTLPYATVAITGEMAALPDTMRHRVRFTARGDDGVSLDVTLAASEFVGRRLTLSYVPATVDDHMTVNAFLTLDNTPAYLVKLLPVLKIDGVVRAAGELPVQMGSLHEVTLDVQAPRASLPVTNALVAGGYYAIGLGTSSSSWQAPQTAAPEDTERAAANLLYGLAADYMTKWNDAERTIGSILGVVPVRPVLAEVIVGSVYNRTVLFGDPQAIDWRGVYVDADLRVTEPVPAGADDSLAREFMELSGLTGSMLESDVLEQRLEVDSVSAVKLLQLARAQGIPIDEINQSNVASAVAALQTDALVKTHITNLVNQGWIATVPRTDFVRSSWRGIGYIVRDPLTGAGGYFISGGLSGGATAQAPEDWVQQQYTSEIGHPYSDPPNADPLAASSITRIPTTDDQRAAAGGALPKPLAVWVRDARGRPVKDADVTFLIPSSFPDGPHFAGAHTVTVKTDGLGIARADLTLGTNTSTFPFYSLLQPTDKHYTQVGRNTVHAMVATGSGSIMLKDPFQRLYTLPAAPMHIRKLLGDGSRALVGTAAGSVKVRIVDKYENPVSNVSVNFSSLLATVEPPGVGPLPINAKLLVMYPLDPPCPIQTPVLGDCNGQPTLSVQSDHTGASVGTILGDTVGTKYSVLVEAAGLPAEEFTLYSEGSRNYANRTYFASTLGMSILQMVTDQGELLNATRIGTLYQRPLGVVIYLLEDNFGLVPTGQPCPAPEDPCFKIVPDGTTRVRKVDIQMAGPDIVYPSTPDPVSEKKHSETASVVFTVIEGGGAPAVRTIKTPGQLLTEKVISANPGNGQYFSWLTVGPNPLLNKVNVTATATVWVPCFDLHTGKVTPKLLTLDAGQRHGNPTGCSTVAAVPGGTPRAVTHEVFGVKVTLEKPAPSRLDYDGKDAFLPDSVVLKYKIEPAEYLAQRADIDIYEFDSAAPPDADGCTCKPVGFVIGDQRSGDGVSRLLSGTRLDRKKSYRLQTKLNRGTDAEVRSDRIDFAFLNGIAEFDYVPADPVNGLVYGSTTKKPIRAAIVDLLDAGGNLVEQTTTNEKGFYSFKPPAAGGNFTVRLNAALGSGNPVDVDVVVVDNTSASKPYVHQFPIAWQASATTAKDIHLKSGWGVAAYSQPRDAAPFAILDTVHQAMKTIRSADRNVVIPLLTVNWSVNNFPGGDGTTPATGNIGTSKYSGSNLYILGQADNDSDEYDSHVIAHEWGHFFEDVLSRSDSVGDTHGAQDILDPRLAFGEGWGNAFSGMVFDTPDPVYVDTGGNQQASSNLAMNVDRRIIDPNAPPPVNNGLVPYNGFYSEMSVQEVLWDLFDSSPGIGPDDDGVALGFEPLYKVLAGPQRVTPAFTTIFSLLKYLKDANPAQTAPIESLADAQNIKAGNEFESAGNPIYTAVPANGTAVTVVANSNIPAGLASPRPLAAIDRTWDPNPPAAPLNKLFDWTFLRFDVATAGAYEIRVKPTGGGDFAFVLNERGTKTTVDSMASGGTETLVKTLAPGTYTLAVTANRKADFSVTITPQ